MSLTKRLKIIESAYKRNKKIVLCVANDKNSAQFRYRCLNLAETTNDSEKWQTVWIMNSEINKIHDVFDDISLLVIQRQTAKNRVILNLIKEAKRKKIRVLFDIDDLVFNYRYLLLLMKSTNSKNIFYWFGYFWGIRRIAKKVDGFLVTNNFLSKKIKESFNKPVRVIPNSLNREQIEKARTDLKYKNQNKYIIGYFSGSPTHFKDFKLIEAELIEFLKKYKETKLRIVGYMIFSTEIKKWIELGRIEVIKPVNYLELQRLIAEVDVNIAPLVLNDFTNCKSELKFFEAAVVETTTIASPTYTFKKAIMDGKNGFLARPGEWYGKLEYLYKHPDENREIALEAKKYALQHYYGAEFLKEVEAAYDYFVK